jgi:hypothetical protein
MLTAALVLLASASADAQVHPYRVLQGTPTSSGGSTMVTCDQSVAVSYIGGAAIVTCPDIKTGALHSYTVLESDTPTPADVIAFVQPYVMTVAQLQAMDRAPTFLTQRVSLQLTNGKITAMSITVQ